MSEPMPAPEAEGRDDAQQPSALPTLSDQDIQRLRTASFEAICTQIDSLMQERHGRRVEVVKTIYSLGDGSLRLTLRTADGLEPALLFTAWIEQDRVLDSYVAYRCLYPMVKALEESLPGTRACATLPDGGYDEGAAGDCMLADYLDLRGDRGIVLHLVMGEDAGVTRDEVVLTVQEISRVFSADVGIRVWVLPEAGLDRCRELLDANPWVSTTLVDDCEPLASWSAFVQRGTVLNQQEAEVS